MHALPQTKDYKTDHFITRCHEENSMMSGLFSQNNLLLCGMQGNNGLLAKTFKKFPISPIQYTASLFSPLIRAKPLTIREQAHALNYLGKLSLAVLNVQYSTPVSVSCGWCPHLHCVFQVGSDKSFVKWYQQFSGFLDTTFLMIQDVICFAFPIILRICSSQQRVLPAETTTPRSLSFSTTCKGV